MVLLSFLLLFLELALIRWTGENIVSLSYFTNFVLLGSFLGIGLGFLRANWRVNGFPFAVILLAGLVAFVRFFPITLTSANGNFIYFGDIRATGPPPALVLTVVFVSVAAEYFALLIGYRALLFVVAGAYAAAYLFGRSHLVERPDVPAAVTSGSP